MNPVANDTWSLPSALSGWLPTVWAQTWQVTLLVVVVAMIARICARRRAHLAHALWLIVLLKCVTPPFISSPTGIFCWLPFPHIDESLLPSDSMASAERHSDRISAGHSQADPDFEFREPGRSQPPVGGDNSAQVPREDIAAAPVHASSNGTLQATERWNANWRSVAGFAVGIVWLAGIGLTCAVSAGRWRRCFRALHGPEAVHPQVERLVTELSRRFGMRQRVRLKITPDTIGPAVVGLWRPTIILPDVIVRETNLCDLEPILAHELLHVRRGDLWVSCLQLAAQWLWWWHPLLWWANRLITRESERCCDQAVLAELRCPPLRYAKCLVDVLELKSIVSVPAFPGVRPVDITSFRLEQIMQLGEKSRKHSPWWCWLVLGVGGCLVLPGAAIIGATDALPAGSAFEVPDSIVEDSLAEPVLIAEIQNTPQSKKDHSAPGLQTITVHVDNSVRGLRAGEPVDILIETGLHAKRGELDPRITLKDAEICPETPTLDEVLRSLPAESKGGTPFVADVSRQNPQIVVQPIATSLGESRYYPMVGPARLFRRHFKCTVTFEKVTRSDWPVPFSHSDQVLEVVYIDHDQLVADDAIETVQLVSVLPQSSDDVSQEIRVAVRPDQAIRLQEAMASDRLLVFQRDPASRRAAAINDETPARDAQNGWAVKVNVLSFGDKEATVDIDLKESVADDLETMQTRQTHTRQRIPVGKTTRVLLDHDKQRSLEITIADPAQVKNKEVAATVNGEPIFAEDILRQLPLETAEVLARAEREAPAEQYRTFRRHLIKVNLPQHIERELLLQALKSKIKPDQLKSVEKEIEAACNSEFLPQAMKQAGVTTEAELDEALRQRGSSLEILRAQFRMKQLAQQYLGSKALPKTGFDRSDALKYYEEHKEDYAIRSQATPSGYRPFADVEDEIKVQLERALWKKAVKTLLKDLREKTSIEMFIDKM